MSTQQITINTIESIVAIIIRFDWLSLVYKPMVIILFYLIMYLLWFLPNNLQFLIETTINCFQLFLIAIPRIDHWKLVTTLQYYQFLLLVIE